MNRIRTTTILLVVLTLAVCATTPALAKVSAREAKKFIEQIESGHQVSFKQMKEQMSARHEIWIQPGNKDVECKVVWTGDEADIRNAKFYWDGECKDGYAAGLGRSFLDSTKGLMAWLEEYGELGEPPLNYYVHGYDAKMTAVGFQDSAEFNPMNMNGVQYNFSDNLSNTNFASTEAYFDPETGYRYAGISNTSDDVVTRVLMFSNNKGFRIHTYLDPTQPAAYWAYYFDGNSNIPFGYGIAIGRNGQVNHMSFKNGSQSEAKLPSELVEHFASLEREISAKLTLAQSHRQRGELAAEVYKRRTCSGELNVDFMDNILYGQICLEHGDFTPYIDKIEELQVKAQKRQEANAQIALRQKEIDAKNRVAAAQQQMAQQAQANQAIANAVQQSSNSLNNILIMRSALMNNYSDYNQGSFIGNSSSQRKTSVCHVMGPIVSCR